MNPIQDLEHYLYIEAFHVLCPLALCPVSPLKSENESRFWFIMLIKFFCMENNTNIGPCVYHKYTA